MKSILLHVESDTGMDARLQVALDLARAFGARLTCLHAVTVEIYAPGDFSGATLAAMLPAVREAAEKLQQQYQAELANEDVDWEWMALDGIPEMHLLEQSAMHDLIVIGEHDKGQRKGPSRMAGSLALNAKCPVLVVPETCKGLDVNAPAMVAWNGSSEAGVALRAAVPLLAMSSKVFLVSVEEAKDKTTLDFPSLKGLQYLARHGIDAELVEISADGKSIAKTLAGAAKSRKSGIMIMGAYGQSRFTEMLLGGVTRKALTEPEMPVFIAH